MPSWLVIDAILLVVALWLAVRLFSREAILTRAAHPFHRQVPAWRERMEAMVTTAEGVIDG